MKKINKIVLVCLFIFTVFSFYYMFHSGNIELSEEYVKDLVDLKGKDNILFSDFDRFESKNIGIGTIIKVYNMKDGKTLFLYGTSYEEYVKCISIKDKNNNEKFIIECK